MISYSSLQIHAGRSRRKERRAIELWFHTHTSTHARASTYDMNLICFSSYTHARTQSTFLFQGGMIVPSGTSVIYGRFNNERERERERERVRGRERTRSMISSNPLTLD